MADQSSQASHDREQGLPGVGKGAFGHDKDFKEDGEPAQTERDGPAGLTETLAADTSAQNSEDSVFKQTLDNAIKKQEESHSTAI